MRNTSAPPTADAEDALRAEVDALMGAPGEVSDPVAESASRVDDAADLARQIEQIIGEEAKANPAPTNANATNPAATNHAPANRGSSNLEAEIDALIADTPALKAHAAPASTEAPSAAPPEASATPETPEASEPPQASAPTPQGTPSTPPVTASASAASTDPAVASEPVVHAASPTPLATPRVVVEEVTVARAVPGVVAILARPLAGKTPIVRGAVALVGVNTLLLAVFVWAFVLFLRPTPQEARAGAFDFEGGAVPRVPAAPVGPATPLDGHAKEAHAKDGHVEPKKSGGKGEKQGGGGH